MQRTVAKNTDARRHLVQQISFHCGLGTLFTHELDAMQEQEWRLLFLLRTLDDSAAAMLFLALHPPIFACITYFAFQSNAARQLSWRRGLSIFFVVHALLHWRLMGDPLAPFDSALSLTLIHSCALFGALYLLLDWQQTTSCKEAL
jgi:hypothetical protein